jgi:hypothetical protein
MSDADPAIGSMLHRELVIHIRGEAENIIRGIVRRLDPDQRDRLKQHSRSRELRIDLSTLILKELNRTC